MARYKTRCCVCVHGGCPVAIQVGSSHLRLLQVYLRQARRGGRAMEQRCTRCAWCEAERLASRRTLVSRPPRRLPPASSHSDPSQTLRGWTRPPPRTTHPCRFRALREPLCHCEQRQRVWSERSSSRCFASDDQRTAARLLLRGRRLSIMAQAMFAYPVRTLQFIYCKV